MSDPNERPYDQQPYDEQPYGGQAPPPAPLDAAQDKQWASFAHLGGILWLLPSLVIWVVFKDRGRLTAQEAKEALNWQITWIIGWVISQMIGLVLGSLPLVGGIGYLLFSLLVPWALYVVNLVLSVLGFIRVNGGGTYRYPINFRFIK